MIFAGTSNIGSRILFAALVYFAIAFGIGFILGVIRVMLVMPRVGERLAELIELPIMLIAITVAARWTVRRFEVKEAWACVAVGVIALVLLAGAEIAVVIGLRGLSLGEYIASRDPISGTLYLFMLGMFALLPVIVGRRKVRQQ